MADFEPAFERTLRNEGGFTLTDSPGDRGGQTYAGIARNFHPEWSGWALVDAGRLGSRELTQAVREFYRSQVWNRLGCDSIASQAIAETVYDFAVNAGVVTSAKLAQLVVGVLPDGGIGPKSLAALNAFDEGEFTLKFAIAKIKRYQQICDRDGSQTRFLVGWIHRALEALT